MPTSLTNTNYTGAGVLYQAAQDAVSGTIIQFDGTLAGQTIDLLQIWQDKELTIDGGNVITLTSTNASTNIASTSGSSYQLTIKNMTIANTNPGYASVFHCSGGTMIVDHVTFLGNTTGSPNNLPVVGGSGSCALTINQATFTNNSAGGGTNPIVQISGASSTLTINNTTFSGNTGTFDCQVVSGTTVSGSGNSYQSNSGCP